MLSESRLDRGGPRCGFDSIDTEFFSCAGGVCDIGAGSNVFVNNFFTTTFLASGGNDPYTWSGQPPAGFTLRPSITLSRGNGNMAPYNMGRFGVSRDQIRVYSALPDISTSQPILIGGSFT